MIDIAQRIWLAFDSRVVGLIKIAVSLAAAGTLAWDALASRRGGSNQLGRTRDRLLAVIGIVAFACWWNLGRFHFDAGYLQLNDQFHYYVGSKYVQELGYTRLYECTAVADDQDGLHNQVQRRWMRNLVTNDLERTSAILGNPRACTEHFAPDRWLSFGQDVRWFRSRLPPEAWDRIQIDHGYNATPVWGVFGHSLTSLAPASERQIVALSLIDPALIVAMWAAVWWAFGWRTMSVALVWWGTNYPARFAWTGGGFLRADWLALTVIAVCLVRRGRYAGGGFALGYAALLRLFPALIVSGLALKTLATMWRTRSWRVPRDHASFAAGAVLAALVLVPLSIEVVGGGWADGIGLWRQFIENSRKHYGTPSTNNVGLRVLAAYGPQSRLADLSEYWVETPLDSWMAARRRVSEQRELFYLLAVAIFLVVFARASTRRSDWIALALGVALLPIALELTCYYYAVLLVPGLLWLEDKWCGVWLAAAAALSNVPAGLFRMDDDVYAAVTTILVVLAIVVTVRMGSEPSPLATSCPYLSS